MSDRAHGRRRAAEQGARAHRPVVLWRRQLALGATLAVLAAATSIGRLGLDRQFIEASEWGLLLSGVVATVTGGFLMWWWVRVRRDRQGLFRLILGASICCWGAGQLLLWQAALNGTLSFPALGDLVSSGSAPLALIALAAMPRRSVSGHPGVRLGLDALAVGAALTFMIWQTVLVRAPEALDARSFGTAMFVLADCATFAAALLLAVRDVHSRITPAVVGLLLHLVADLSVLLSVDPAEDRVVAWPALILWCLAWPLIGIGVLRFNPYPRTREVGALDRREAVAAQLATLIIAVAVIAAVTLDRKPTGGLDVAAQGSAALVVLLLPLIFAREALSTQLRLKLTSGLRQQAFRDSLTGLPNRRALISRIADLENSDTPWVVLTLDLDGFKQVNDLLGHHAGDELLVTVAEAMRQNCGPGTLAARIGGDEFAVLSPGDLDAGQELAEQLRVAVRDALGRQAPGLGTTASVGVGRLVRGEQHRGAAAGPRGSADHRDQLTGLVESGAALRAAKESGPDGVQVYSGEVAAARERRLLLENRLRLAITEAEIETYGQPIVDLGSGRLTGFEALARWSDPELGAVSPVEFIAVAEQTGMVVALGEHLVEVTLEAARAAGVFAAGLTVSINVSPIQLRVPGFVDVMRFQLARTRVRPEQVILEVTEAILVAEGDPALRALADLNTLGVAVAIDDFGTGYSALGYLRRLPVQIIKIDRSLTSSLLIEPKTVAIVEGVVRMAHRMGMKVTMEGIEDDLEADTCRAVGADHGQGWLFGRPMPWSDTAALVAGHEARPRPGHRPVAGPSWQPSSP